MLLISFENLKKIIHIQKLQGCGLKTEPATPFSILDPKISKSVWQAHFSSHAPVFFWNNEFFNDVEIILLIFFDISNQKSVIQKFPFAVPIHNPHPVYAL